VSTAQDVADFLQAIKTRPDRRTAARERQSASTAVVRTIPAGGFWQEQAMKTRSLYSAFSQAFSRASGQPVAFGAAVTLVALWIVSGPVFHFSDTWQLVMNTISSIVTFLMVFVIQNTQNRSTDAIQVKLDELIATNHGAHDSLLDLEELEDDDVVKLRERYLVLARQARAARHGGGTQGPDGAHADKAAGSSTP
jgi:low affinity Fe/Cu permease